MVVTAACLGCVALTGSISRETWTYLRLIQGARTSLAELSTDVRHDVRDSKLTDESLYRELRRFAAPESSRIILLVDAKGCDRCGDASKAWLQFLRSSRGKPDAWIVTPSEDKVGDLPRFLEAEGIPFRLLTPSDPKTFSAKTGIRGMPMGFVLAAGRQVECVFSGAANVETLRKCGLNIGSPAGTFLAAGRMEIMFNPADLLAK